MREAKKHLCLQRSGRSPPAIVIRVYRADGPAYWLTDQANVDLERHVRLTKNNRVGAVIGLRGKSNNVSWCCQ